jgi:hypothetical protein
MSLENAELVGGMASDPGPRTCKVASFLADPTSWGLTTEDRDWLAGQLAVKAASPRDGQTLSYTRLAAKFANETRAQGKPGRISPSIMSNHANGLCICHT